MFLWFPSNAGHSVILLRCGQLKHPLASSGLVFPQVDIIHMIHIIHMLLITVLPSFGLHSPEQTRHRISFVTDSP